jgi:putative ABC transport system substrate-binding protein
MKKNIFGLTVGALLFALCFSAQAQQPKVYRVGVLLPGEAWYEIVDGLRIGLKQVGLEEGKQFTLAIQDWKGDAKVAEEAAKNFEQEKVSLIYTTSTNSTIAARRATTDIPIVFCAGTDPVVLGLVDSFAKPGGRLTGVYQQNILDSPAVQRSVTIVALSLAFNACNIVSAMTFFRAFFSVSLTGL